MGWWLHFYELIVRQNDMVKGDRTAYLVVALKQSEDRTR